MSGITVDRFALKDPRFTVLAQELGCNRYEAWGRVLFLWDYCLESGSAVHSPRMVCAAMDHAGGAAAMVTANLAAEPVAGLVRVRGAEERIAWLKQKRESAAAGGKARAKQTLANAQANASVCLPSGTSKGAPLECPPTPTPTPSSGSSSSDSSGDLLTKGRSQTSGSGVEREARPTTAAHPDHAAFVEAFQQAYCFMSTSKPTWGAKEGAMVKRLLKAHGLEELKRRMGIMFDWPQGQYPVTTAPTMSMLAQHIDTFVAPPAQKPVQPVVNRFDPPPTLPQSEAQRKAARAELERLKGFDEATRAKNAEDVSDLLAGLKEAIS